MTLAEAVLTDPGTSASSSIAFANRNVATAPYVYRDITAYSQVRNLPNWLRQARAKLNQLRCLPANWNSYGAKQVTPGAIEAAYKLLQEMATHATPYPAIVPTSDGSVQLEWHTRGIDLELRILSPTRLGMTFEDLQHGQELIEAELQYDFTELRKIFEMLDTRAP
jgi:hypothetical protein